MPLLTVQRADAGQCSQPWKTPGTILEMLKKQCFLQELHFLIKASFFYRFIILFLVAPRVFPIVLYIWQRFFWQYYILFHGVFWSTFCHSAVSFYFHLL